VILKDIPGGDTKQKALARASQVPGWPTGKLAKVRSEEHTSELQSLA
jgi:hypothetical protein